MVVASVRSPRGKSPSGTKSSVGGSAFSYTCGPSIGSVRSTSRSTGGYCRALDRIGRPTEAMADGVVEVGMGQPASVPAVGLSWVHCSSLLLSRLLVCSLPGSCEAVL